MLINFLCIICLFLQLSFLFIFVPLIPSQVLPPYAGSQGEWNLLHESIGISAMHMQLLHDNRVIMFDRTDFGQSNLSLSSGRCRFDPYDTVLHTDCTAHSILYDVATNAYRPLMVQTDTWCSSGSVLPNGTLVQSGGYNDGDHVVRTFTPCDDDQCDWIELPQHLSERRWLVVSHANPSWVMEEMPLPRVMGDMILLPNGDVIIINGAQLGTAGWELARGPMTRPIIYRPSEQTSRRFSVMEPSTRPRINPHIYYNFTNVVYPTDLSLEAYSPPYLSAEYATVRPKILSLNETIGYKATFQVRFSVEEYLSAGVVSVRLIAPSFTTHSFGMNQKMVVLKILEVSHVTSYVYHLAAVAPSTAEIAPPGYYLLFVVHAEIPSSGMWVKME
ncbi:hypothetical protein CUMW_154540 [Citrus unshiu]|nr:hypothetical protein CUMW_154540 [Citrus unshiu]